MKAFKKILLYTVAVCFAVSMGGCSKERAQKAGETVDIRVFVNNGAVSAGSTSTTEDLEMVRKKIAEETGVNPITVASGNSASTDKLNVMLASGEKIDAFWGAWPDYAKDGVIIPIGGLLDKYGSAIKREMLPDSWPSVTDEDGKIWGIPRSVPGVQYPTFVRKDWLDKYGLPMPQTLDDIERTLETFKKNDPAGNGTTIPLVLQWAGIKRALSAGFTGTGYGQWLDPADGKVKPTEIHPGFKQLIEKTAEWYKKGYIDREGFLMNASQIREKIKQNKVGMHTEWYSNVTLFEPDLRLNVPDAQYAIAKWVGPAGKPETIGKVSQNAMVITKSCKHPEAVIKLVNWYHENMANFLVGANGIEGVHWEYKNPEKTQFKKLNPDKTTYAGEFNFALGIMEMKADPNDPDNTIHQKYLLSNMLDFDRAVKGLDYSIYYNSNTIDEQVPGLSDINRMMEEENIKFIIGVRPLSEYDKYISNLYKIGLDKWIDTYTAEYKRLTGN